MADQVNPSAIPDKVLLSLRAAKPRALDWNHKTGLNADQLALLALYQMLSFAAKAELTHGLKEGDFIPAHKIKVLYMNEHATSNVMRARLKDTTGSDLA